MPAHMQIRDMQDREAIEGSGNRGVHDLESFKWGRRLGSPEVWHFGRVGCSRLDAGPFCR